MIRAISTTARLTIFGITILCLLVRDAAFALIFLIASLLIITWCVCADGPSTLGALLRECRDAWTSAWWDNRESWIKAWKDTFDP